MEVNEKGTLRSLIVFKTFCQCLRRDTFQDQRPEEARQSLTGHECLYNLKYLLDNLFISH